MAVAHDIPCLSVNRDPKRNKEGTTRLLPPSTTATDKLFIISVVTSEPMAHPFTNKHAWEARGGDAGNVVILTRGGVSTTEVKMSKPTAEAPAAVDSFAGARKKHKISIVDPMNRFNSMSHEEQIASLPFCLVDKELTLEEFHAQCDALEGSGCSRCEFRDGGAWIYEAPLALHDDAAGEVIVELVRQMGDRSRDFKVSASPRCDNNYANWSFEPDGSLRIRGFRPGPNHVDAADSLGNRWPNLIVEIAHSETEEHVRVKALAWLDTAENPEHGVQQVIVIKIGSTVRGDGHRTMKAWRYERGADINPVQEIVFGNHGPNNGATLPGSPGMQLHVPIRAFYLPLPPPDELGETLDLDLFYIRKVIEEAF